MNRIERYRTAWSRYCKSHGYGIHSPFAYRFVLDVMHEQRPYYAYDDIKQLRNAILAESKFLGSKPRVISLKHAKLLFRVVNYYNPQAVLQIGSSFGVSAACSLMVSRKIDLWLHEPHFDDNKTLKQTLQPYGERIHRSDSIVQSITDYSAAVSDLDHYPMVVINNIPNEDDYNQLQVYIYSILDKQGVVIFRNIGKKGLMQQLWTDSKLYAQHGMTFSNDRMAVFVANPDLPRQDFMLWY